MYVCMYDQNEAMDKSNLSVLVCIFGARMTALQVKVIDSKYLHYGPNIFSSTPGRSTEYEVEPLPISPAYGPFLLIRDKERR